MTNISDTPAPAAHQPHPAFGEGARAYDVPALDTHIHTIEHGTGDPIVFIHGNPTSSYLWRHIFHRLRGRGRLLALDLAGFGQSGKPDIAYTLENQQRYVDAWFDALDLKNVTLVLQDYGAAFGLNWASRHPDRVQGVAFFESVLRAIDSAAVSPEFVATRARLRQAGEGERFVLEENRFLTELFPWFFLTPLAEDDLRQYQAPFPTPDSRRPVLAGPRNLPLDGEPVESVAFLAQAEPWLAGSETPKLLLTFEPGFLLTPAILEWSRKTIRNLEVQAAGAGIHYVQEEQPEAIARLLGEWLDPRSTHHV
ncbi:MAG: Haloalkane dehalogenase [Paracidovorax wautersii]|uniref:Haloalkane dehalogenase n=1 Tax=Paracidovorax wautersii TaxID=1177982 RepID=A0A7V8FRX9_9BURK|nr:MAG: Haloalkane dehalogenase [Paracidovorax wautersii]